MSEVNIFPLIVEQDIRDKIVKLRRELRLTQEGIGGMLLDILQTGMIMTASCVAKGVRRLIKLLKYGNRKRS